MKVFIYCRKSSEEDTKQVQSLDTQERLNVLKAKDLGLEVKEIYKEAKSAKQKDNRPQFTEMIQRIRSGEADRIIVTHLDRLARNGHEATDISDLIREGKLKEVITQSNRYTTSRDVFYMGFDFIFAAQYSVDLSIKVKEGQQTKLEKGEFPTHAPIGYLNKDKKIYPDPIRAPFIKKAFEYFLEGYSTKEISVILFEEGFRSKKGNLVRKGSIYKILKNHTYYGVIWYKKTITPGIHEPIITKELFDAVQKVFEGKKHVKKQKHDYLYRGFLTCAVCECSLTATTKKDIYLYYYCTNGKFYCSEHKKYMREEYIHELLAEKIKSFDFKAQRELIDMSFDVYATEEREKQAKKIKSNADVKARITKIDNQVKELVLMRTRGEINFEEMNEAKLALLQEKESLQKILNTSKEDLNATLELLENFKNGLYNLETVFTEGDREVKRDFINSLLWNLEFKDQKIASEKYKLPYELAINAAKTGDFAEWRRVRDSNS